jgi:hypothetical protein
MVLEKEYPDARLGLTPSYGRPNRTVMRVCARVFGTSWEKIFASEDPTPFAAVFRR